MTKHIYNKTTKEITDLATASVSNQSIIELNDHESMIVQFYGMDGTLPTVQDIKGESDGS